MATQRADKAKNVDKVIAEIVKNPLRTQREIAESTGLGNGTVARAMKDVEQNGAAKEKRIVSLTDADFRIVQLTQKHTEAKLVDAEESKKISARDLAYIGDVSAKRYSLLMGNVTDTKGGLNSVKEMSTDEILKRLEE
jgi:DNA-binding MarR family transcriptional regulator